MRTAGVLTGLATREDLAPHADVVLADIGQLHLWLQGAGAAAVSASRGVKENDTLCRGMATSRVGACDLLEPHRQTAAGEITMNDEAPIGRKAAGRRAGGRRGHADRAGGAAISQTPWRIPVNPDRPTEPLDEEGIAAIHRGAMRILSEIGIEFLNEDAVAHLKAAGCTVEGLTVRFDPAFVEEMVARAPAQFTLTPRNPDRAIPVGGRHMLFGNVSSPPNAVGSRPRQAARRFRDISRVHQAHAVFQLHAFRRRLPGGAHRHPPLGAASRLSFREADAHRQGGPRLQPRDRAGRGRDGDGAHRGRAFARGVRREPADVHQHQLGQPAET